MKAKLITIILLIICLHTFPQAPLHIKEHYDDVAPAVKENNRYLKKTENGEEYWDRDSCWSNNQLGDGMSKVIFSYLIMYETTGDKAYLIKFINETIKIQNWRYDTQDPNNPNYYPKWTLESDNNGQESVYQNAMIIMPMAKFVYMVKNNSDLYNTKIPLTLINWYEEIINESDLETYGTFAEWLSHRVEQTIEYLNNYRWCDKHGLMSKDKKKCKAKLATHLNMQGPYGVALLYMALATNNEDYFEKAAIMYAKYKGKRHYWTIKFLGICWKRNTSDVLELRENNSYTFRYTGWKTVEECDGPLLDDIGHAVWSLIFPVETHQIANNFFTDEDMVRFRNTFTKNIWDEDLQGFHSNVYGTDENCADEAYFNKYKYNSLCYMPFYKYDNLANESPNAYDIIINFYENEIYNRPMHNNYAQPFYGLARVVEAQWEKENVSLILKKRNVVYDQDFYAKNKLIVDPSYPNMTYPQNTHAFADPTDFTENKFIIDSGITVNMVAGNGIILKNGFQVKKGAKFHAYIDPGLENKKQNTAPAELPQNFRRIFDSILTVYLYNDTALNSYENQDSFFEQNYCDNIYISPNPAQTELNIEYQVQQETPVEISVYNIQGVKVKQISVSEKTAGFYRQTINLSDLPAGIYTIVFKTSEKTISKKFVKQ